MVMPWPGLVWNELLWMTWQSPPSRCSASDAMGSISNSRRLAALVSNIAVPSVEW